MLKDPDNMQKLCIYMPLDMASWVEEQAKKYAISKSAIVKQIIAKEIERVQKSEASVSDLGKVEEERRETHGATYQ